MNINRHNYEEFFILYWDNELAADQKREVEVFVEKHTDLKEEFRLFGQTRFAPETNIAFENKELLSVDERAFINLSNFEEILVLFIDDELTAEQRALVEKFTTLHPFVHKELAILQKTKLQPEVEISFLDKSALYRREEKVRVVKMVWWRVAVAAAIIIVAGFFTLRLNTSEKTVAEKPSVAGINESTQKNVIPGTRPDMADNQKQKGNFSEYATEQKAETPAGGKNNIIPDSKSAFVKGKQNNLVQQQLGKNEPSLAITNLPEINSGSLENTPTINKAANDAIAKESLKETNDIFTTSDVTSRANPAYVVYNPGSEKETQSDKGGLKGFLRKTTRVFERRTNVKTTTDDNKLLVGMFAVSLK
jgi:hypothetical protein